MCVISNLTLNPWGHWQVARWLLATHWALVPHSSNPRQGSVQRPARHSCNTGH